VKTPDWVVKSMQKLGLVRRDTLTCDCGKQGHPTTAPDCARYKIVTCPDCNKQWAVYLGRSK
jgi:hypothetical protein